MTEPSPPPPSILVVRLIVRDAAGRVLILRRADADVGGGMWCLPGGKIDPGETAGEAARRELLEETALECTACRFLFEQESPAADPSGIPYLNYYYECAARGQVCLNAESAALAWIAPGEIAKYALVFRNGEGLRRYFAEFF